MSKLRWGVLGVAGIATRKVIPAIQKSALGEVVAIASRDGAKARAAADSLGIEASYGSYEDLLADPNVEAIYNPLPNHLHVPWSIRAAEAGLHVLCEKPIGLNVEECLALMAVRDRTGVKISEAFMVRVAQQWLRARELVRSGEIGELRAIVSCFSYSNRDAANIRSKPEMGGGALMDIGCYPVQISRFLFEAEPLRVVGMIERDPEFGVDRLSSGMMEFERGQSIFSCGTQHVPYQRVQVLGSKGRVELEIPFNTLPDRPVRLIRDTGAAVTGSGITVEELPASDQYTLQADAFARAVREGQEVPTPLEDSLGNMKVLEGLFESSRVGGFVRI